VLEDYLDDFQGSVVTVSHDRYFLDRVVQRTFAFEGDGRVVEYPGGYSMYLSYRPAKEPAAARDERPKAMARAPAPAREPAGSASKSARKLSSKERRELEQLEDRIAELEGERDKIAAALNDGGSDYTRYAGLADELARLEAQIEQSFNRWAELSELAS
jgi:ATP-binding cassette subfamily F protein uup